MVPRGIAIHAFNPITIFAQYRVVFYKTGSFTYIALDFCLTDLLRFTWIHIY
jgi:hypothetical protein